MIWYLMKVYLITCKFKFPSKDFYIFWELDVAEKKKHLQPVLDECPVHNSIVVVDSLSYKQQTVDNF